VKHAYISTTTVRLAVNSLLRWVDWSWSSDGRSKKCVQDNGRETGHFEDREAGRIILKSM